MTQEDERTYLERQVATFEHTEREAYEALLAAKTRLGYMKSAAAARREYAPPEEFRAAETEVRLLGQKHQEALKAGAKYRKSLRALGPTRQALIPGQPRSFHEHFVRVAKTMLPAEVFGVICAAAEAAESHSEDAKARELTGLVLPALAGVPGMRERK